MLDIYGASAKSVSTIKVTNLFLDPCCFSANNAALPGKSEVYQIL